MMLMRSLIGSLAAVGVIGALAAVLPERHSPSKPAAAPTFGELPKAAETSAKADQGASRTDGQSLVKLAAYSGTRDAGTAPASGDPGNAASAAPPLVRAVRVVGTPVPAPPASTAPALVASAVSPTPTQAASPTPAPPISPAPAEQPPATPQTVAAPPPAQLPQATSGNRIDLNHASVAELDRLPGAGRIGAAIARRRPYRSVEDLVRKRVVRASIYARIRSAVTVD